MASWDVCGVCGHTEPLPVTVAGGGLWRCVLPVVRGAEAESVALGDDAPSVTVATYQHTDGTPTVRCLGCHRPDCPQSSTPPTPETPPPRASYHRPHVPCTVEEFSLAGDHGFIPSVCVTCRKCGHYEEAYGTGENSIVSCLARLRENCPEGERNWYEVESED